MKETVNKDRRVAMSLPDFHPVSSLLRALRFLEDYTDLSFAKSCYNTLVFKQPRARADGLGA